ARTAHTDMRAPRRGDFPPARDLFPEQERVHAAAGAGYLTLFGEQAAQSAAAVDPMATELPDRGIRLVGPVGLAVDLDDGTREIRFLRLGRRDEQALVDVTDVWFALLRAQAWLADVARLHVVAADLLTLEVVEHDVDVGAESARAAAWLDDGIA